MNSFQQPLPVTLVTMSFSLNLPECSERGGLLKLRIVHPAMEVLTSKFTRRSTRIRVEIPVSVLSLDRRRPFGEKCVVLIVSAQGCGFRASEELQVETPIMLSGLPGGGS